MSYHPGDLVVYGTTGVCRVEEICKPGLNPSEKEKEYYLLHPLFQDGVIYAPLDNGKIVMRDVISREEAQQILSDAAQILPTVQRAPTLQALAQRYQESVRSGDCKELITLMISIHEKRRQAETSKRRLGMVDERYYKQAEHLLCGELSVALDRPMEEISSMLLQILK